jgi:nicotinamide-nucleotide amidase
VRDASSHAIILTVGDEITSGDVANTNGAWLAQRLGDLGVPVRMLAAVPDDCDEIAVFVSAHQRECAHLLLTGGLGGTPDDVTREAVAQAFGVELEEHEPVATALRRRFPDRVHEYVGRFAMLPAGATPIRNPLGGAPGFVLANVYVFPGVPAEMRATFGQIEERFRSRPIRSVRLAYETTESEIVSVLEAAAELHPDVQIGSYPLFEDGRRRVDIVVKSSDEEALEEAASWLRGAVREVLSH